MKRAWPWIVLAAGALALWWAAAGTPPPGGAAPPADGRRPNVLIVVLDTVRADRLALYGHGADTSPRLSAFAEGAVVFRRAVSPGMWTVPSHASLFTGLPVSAHGTHATHKWLDHRFVTLAEVFSAAGAPTFLFSANPFLQGPTNLTQGFEATAYPWAPPWRRKAAAWTGSKLLQDDASNALGPRWRAGPYDSPRAADRMKDAGPVAAEALGAFIDGADAPWFAVVNLMEAHTPRVPSRAAREAVSGASAITAQLALDQSDGRQLAHTVGVPQFDDADLDVIAQVYDAAVRDADAAFGDLVDALTARGVLDDTLVVVVSDHGEHLGEDGLLGHKFSVRAPLVQVPLLLCHPSLAPAVRPEVVSVLGVFATVVGVAGVPAAVPDTSRDLRGPDPYGGVAVTELLSATPRALARVGAVHPNLDWTPFLRPWVGVETASLRCMTAADGERVLRPVGPDGRPVVRAVDTGEADAVCAGAAAWRATFAPYDPTEAGPDDKREVTLPAATRAQLEALGYLE